MRDRCRFCYRETDSSLDWAGIYQCPECLCQPTAPSCGCQKACIHFKSNQWRNSNYFEIHTTILSALNSIWTHSTKHPICYCAWNLKTFCVTVSSPPPSWLTPFPARSSSSLGEPSPVLLTCFPGAAAAVRAFTRRATGGRRPPRMCQA